MTVYKFTASAAPAWSLTADSANPFDPDVDPLPDRALVDGLTGSWATDVLPPVAAPSTAQFSIYDSGLHPDGWLPIQLGQPVRLTLRVYPPGGDPAGFAVMIMEGRITDLSANNHRRGGVVYSVIVTDRLGADLAGDGSPKTIPVNPDDLSMVRGAYDFLKAEVDALANFDYDHPTADFENSFGRDFDATNKNVLDVLNLYVIHDLRLNAGHLALNILHQVIPTVSDDPEPEGSYQLIEYDPQAAHDLDRLMVLTFTDPLWTVIPDPNYYATSNGVKLTADQLLFDVGEWRQLRSQAINQVELTGMFERGAGTGDHVETVRARFPDLIRDYGTNSRSVPSMLWYRAFTFSSFGALEIALILLGNPSDLQQGFGFSAATIVWDQLTVEQHQAWAEQLWPIDDRQAYGRPLAILNVPDQWRLADHDLVFGRLMGLTFQLSGGELLAQLIMRQVPPGTAHGVTFTELLALVPAPTFATFDPNVTFALMSMTRD